MCFYDVDKMIGRITGRESSKNKEETGDSMTPPCLDGWRNGTDDTSKRKRKDGKSWKEFLLMKMGKDKDSSFGKCSVEGCEKDAEDGAHIWNKCEATLIEKGKYYVKYRIVPMCEGCNNPENTSLLTLKKDTKTPIEEGLEKGFKRGEEKIEEEFNVQ